MSGSDSKPEGDFLFDLEPAPAPEPWMATSEIHQKLITLPRLRVHYRAGSKGRTFVYYGWDGRTLGMGTQMLGKIPADALKRYHEWEARRSEKMAAKILAKKEHVAGELKALAYEAVDLLRLVLGASEARPKPGIYFLLGSRGELLYVGKSDNVIARMHGHDEKGFEFVKMIHVESAQERTRLEGRLIKLLKPPLNVSQNGESHTRRLMEADSFYSIPQQDRRGRKKKAIAS